MRLRKPVGTPTEIWDIADELQRPPKWNAEGLPRPKIVYLDQWCWDHITRDRARMRQGTPDEGIYHFLKERAHAGAIVIPLSQAHYQENWVRTNKDARWDTAVVMAELSGFTTICPTELADWEAALAVAAYFDLDLSIAKPEVFGWGHVHCIYGVERPAFIVNARSGERADWSTMNEDQRLLLQQVEDEAAYRVELAVLALREPRLDMLDIPVPWSVTGLVGDRFREEQIRVRNAIDEHGRTVDVVRNTVEVQSFVESLPFLYTAAARLGQSWYQAMEQLAGLAPGARTSAIHDVLSAMPVQSAFAELRLRAHMKRSFGWLASDGMDFFAMAQIMPFVDVVVTDRRTFNLMNEAKVQSWQNVSVLRKLTDLRSELEEN